MKLIDVIPELTFVYATEYSEAYVIKENGFRPMILVVDILNKEFFINYHKYSYQKQSDITKAVYDFQNEHIEKGYKEDSLIFRKLKNSKYRTLIEKMLNSLDEKKELFCEKVKYEGKADKTLEEKLGSKEYKKFIEHCEELCNRPFLSAINYCYSDIDNSKVEMYDAEPYVFSAIWNFDGNGQITSSYSNNINTTIKQITPDIQHIITPSKNYFLFKLS